MKISKKLICITMMIFLMLFLSSPAACMGQEARTITDQDIMEQKLDSDEMRTVKEAVDKALRGNDISRAYRFNSEDILSSAAKGMPLDSLDGLPGILFSVLGKELKSNMALILQLFAVMLLGAVVRSLQPLESGIPNEAAKLGVNGILVVIASVSFGSMVNIARTAIESMQDTAAVAMPALFALMAASGRVVSVTAIQPLMLIGVNTACQIFKTVLLPVSVIAGLLFLIDSVSERFKLKTLAKLLKACAVWATGVITLVFSILVSIQKLASSSVDAVALKTTKFAIGTFVPVAGKYMTDAAETILLCTSAARNAAGILTLVGLGLIFAIPFIKIFVVMVSFRLAAAFGSPLCDECICDALEDSAGCLSVILGIMGAAVFVLILLTGSLMNSGGVMS